MPCARAKHRKDFPPILFRERSVGLPNHLEALQGDRQGQYSIRINGQWRICFEWKDGDAFEVEIVDYH
jgi:plasmid maintenance system killer protein